MEVLSFSKQNHPVHGAHLLSLLFLFFVFVFLMDIGMLLIRVFILVEQELDREWLFIAICA